LPLWFKAKHPKFIDNLITNQNRLTTPYDLHMTLKHIIELSGRAEKLPQASSCPQAQSLFEIVPPNRSCEDACIEFHWCACTAYKKLWMSDNKAMEATQFVIDWMNTELKLKAQRNGKALCAFRKLSRVVEFKISEEVFDANTSNEHVYYLMKFNTSPKDAEFETTVAFFRKTSKFKISGDISRLNLYGLQSECVTERTLKKFCFCNDLLNV
jgi:hypothetical protein